LEKLKSMIETNEYRVYAQSNIAFVKTGPPLIDYFKFFTNENNEICFAIRPYFPKIYYNIYPVYNSARIPSTLIFAEVYKIELLPNKDYKLTIKRYLNIFSKFSICISKVNLWFEKATENDIDFIKKQQTKLSFFNQFHQNSEIH
jgi:hypothetical protein